MKQQLKGKYTHRVAEMMCRLRHNLTLGVPLRRYLLWMLKSATRPFIRKCVNSQKICVRWHRWIPQTLEAHERWYVSSDGCRTNSPAGWKKTKVSCVFRDYPQLGSNSLPRARPESIVYTANRQDADQCGKDLYVLATHSGIYQEDIATQEVVFIGDGAGWIWNPCDEH